ncbi:MAG: DUF2066 domain-containing protein [Alphaproteobacteria bacterium]|nr:DUF2066 domain-containing protein [Alphaproteobacteria bacterium]
MSKIFACILCIAVLLTGNVNAADDRYSVVIKVDVSDENASIAREKALNSATRAAVNAIAKRISTSDGAKKIANMTDAQIINFVKETSVINEKNSDVRYMAELKIVVNDELLREYMKEREIPVVSQNGATVLIIPIFREFSDDTPILWETDNLWRQAWDNSADTSAIKFVSISQNPMHQSMIDAKQASDFDYIAIENIASSANTNNIYVLDASYKGVEGLIISAKSFSGDKFEIEVEGAKSSGIELFNQAVQQTKSQIEQHLLSNDNSQEEEQNEITVLYPFPALKYWITAEQKIKSITNITEMQVQAMTPGKAQFKIVFTGSLNNLQKLLSALGYELEDGGNHMVLSDIGE